MRRRRHYQLDRDGSYLLGKLLNTYDHRDLGSSRAENGTTATASPRDVDGNELTYPAGQQITNIADATASRRR